MKHRKRNPGSGFLSSKEIFHARCEGEYLNCPIFSLFEINSKAKRLFPITCNQILLSLHLCQHSQTEFHGLKDIWTEIDVAPLTMVSKIRRQTRQLQPHLNVHAEERGT